MLEKCFPGSDTSTSRPEKLTSLEQNREIVLTGDELPQAINVAKNLLLPSASL